MADNKPGIAASVIYLDGTEQVSAVVTFVHPDLWTCDLICFRRGLSSVYARMNAAYGTGAGKWSWPPPLAP